MSRALTAAALLGVVVAGCGEKTFENEDLEAKLKSGVARAGGVEPKSVDCPDDLKVEKGKQFDCTVVTPDGAQRKVHVTLTDDTGRFTFVAPRP